LAYRVFGTGHAAGDAVRFQQQDLGWDGRDIRSWTITAAAGGVVAAVDAPLGSR
jgi:H+/Cl- antiporter ClcA